MIVTRILGQIQRRAMHGYKNEMTLKFITLATLLEDLNLVTNTHMVVYNHL